jgi:hypothetical protein
MGSRLLRFLRRGDVSVFQGVDGEGSEELVFLLQCVSGEDGA